MRELPARLRHAGGGKRLALAELARATSAVAAESGCGEAELLGDPCGHGDRAVGARRDQAAEREGAAEALDRGLVVGRDDAAPVGEGETRARAGSRSQTACGIPSARAVSSTAELLGAGAEHEQAAVFLAHRTHSVVRVGRPRNG